jgi:hypothetical protein
MGCMFCACDRVGGSYDPEAQLLLVGFNHTQRQMQNFHVSLVGHFTWSFSKLTSSGSGKK